MKTLAELIQETKEDFCIKHVNWFVEYDPTLVKTRLGRLVPVSEMTEKEIEILESVYQPPVTKGWIKIKYGAEYIKELPESEALKIATKEYTKLQVALKVDQLKSIISEIENIAKVANTTVYVDPFEVYGVGMSYTPNSDEWRSSSSNC